jgi:hypothetical protein
VTTYVDFGRRPREDAFHRFLREWREMDALDQAWRDALLPSRLTDIGDPPRVRRDPNRAGQSHGSWLTRAATRV